MMIYMKNIPSIHSLLEQLFYQEIAADIIFHHRQQVLLFIEVSTDKVRSQRPEKRIQDQITVDYKTLDKSQQGGWLRLKICIWMS